MYTLFSYALIMFLTISCNAQKKTQSDEQECNRLFDSTLSRWIYMSTTRAPEFPGGSNKLSLFISKNLRYPSTEDRFKGSIKATFIVEKDGAITNTRIEGNESLSEIDKEVLRVIRLMPKWSPGECSGKQVPAKVTLPINL